MGRGTNHDADLQRRYAVICSSCGVQIRLNDAKVDDRMCLICHARLLNDYLQRQRKKSGGEGRALRRH